MCALVEIINEAYLVEAHFVSGPRTDEAEIRDKLLKARFLVADNGIRIVACVFLEVHPPTSYWGLLAVDPGQQGDGLGGRLADLAETEARRAGAEEATILVVNLRRNLRGWYTRLGYEEVGTQPFSDPEKLRKTCHFVKMRKNLSNGPTG